MHNHTGNKLAGEKKFFYGYIIVAAGFLILVIQGGAQYSFGVFLKPVLTEFGWTRSVTAGAYSINWMFFAIFSILAGRLTDKFSPRLVVVVCGLLVSLSYFLMSQINSIWQIYLIYGVLLSLGGAGVYITLLSTIARWFTLKRGLASGIVVAGIGMGTIIMPPLASFLISNYSWRISYMVIAALALMTPVVFAQFMKREPRTAVKFINTADEDRSSDLNLSVVEFSPRQALRTSQLWMLCCIFFIQNICLQVVITHIVAYATDVGIAATIAATIVSVIGMLSVISKIGTGIAIDKLRSKRILIILAVCLFVSFLLLQLSGELWLLYLFAVIFAFGYGGFATSISPSVAEYFGMRAHGTIFGIISFAAGMGGAAGPYVAGLIFDVTGSYELAFWICAVLCVAAIILSILLRTTDKSFMQGK